MLRIVKVNSVIPNLCVLSSGAEMILTISDILFPKLNGWEKKSYSIYMITSFRRFLNENNLIELDFDKTIDEMKVSIS